MMLAYINLRSIYQYCKQHFRGQGNRIPRPAPSPRMRWLPGLFVAFHEPVKVKNMILSAESYLPKLWHLWYVVFKDVQRSEIALGASGQDH